MAKGHAKKEFPPPSHTEPKIKLARRIINERVNPLSPVAYKVELAKRTLKEIVSPYVPSDKEKGKNKD